MQQTTVNKIYQLQQYSWLKVAGSDAQAFLQGQLTCDMRKINHQHSSLALHCNVQGRIISAMRVLQAEDSYLLELPLSMINVAKAAFDKYALFSKVKIEAITTSLTKFGLTGNTIAQHFSQFPTTLNEVTNIDNYKLIKIANNRIEIICLTSNSKKLWQQFSSWATTSPAEEWDLFTLKSGISTIYPETSEKFLPHRLNFQNLSAISFNKGCYLGQEIIARTQYLGKLKHQLCLINGPDNQHIIAGEMLHNQAGQAIGQLVNIIKHQQIYALASIEIAHAFDQTIKINNNDWPMQIGVKYD